MNTPLRAGVLLVALECLVLGGMTRSLFFPLGVTLLALAALFTATRISLAITTHRRLVLYLGILFLADGILRPHPPTGISGFMLFALGWSMAQWLLCLQVMHLHSGKGNRRETWLVLAGVLILLAAGNQVMSPTSSSMLFFRLSSLLFVFGSLNYLTATPDSQGIFLRRIVIMIMITALALPYSPMVSSSMPWLESWYNRIFNPDSARHAGFSGRIDLSAPDPDGPDATATALRIEAGQAPGYLRGQCFSRFEQGEWTGGSPASTRIPPLAGSPGTTGVELSILAARDMENAMFTPGGTTRMQVPAGLAFWTADGIAQRLEGDAGEYQLQYLPALLPSGSTATSELLLIPAEIQTTLRSVLPAIFPAHSSAREKANRLESWFQNNYSYGRPPAGWTGTEAIKNFLLEKHPAHCQYFATAGALILRAAGIPTRVIAGYVAIEQNPLGDYWLARNRDAHAWVEVLDESGDWFRLDPTPEDGRPGQQNGNYAGYLLDAVLHRIQRTLIDLRRDGLSALQPIAQIAGTVLVIIGLLVFSYRWLSHRGNRPPERKPVIVSHEEIQWQQILLQLDDWLEQRKLSPRGAGETLDQLIRRLQGEGSQLRGGHQMIQALDRCANLRYGRSQENREETPSDILAEALTLRTTATDSQVETSTSTSTRQIHNS